MIGIGAGDPEQVTLQAVRAMQQVDVFIVLDKGEAKQELVDLRTELLRRHAGEHRVVVGRDPERDRTGAQGGSADEAPKHRAGGAGEAPEHRVDRAGEAGEAPEHQVGGAGKARTDRRGGEESTAAYVEAVDDWRRRRADVCAELIATEVGVEQVGGFLVWGDPALYDSTLAILDDILARGDLVFGVEVIPGISSVSTLAARHRIGLNRVGRPVHITTGRRFATGWPEGVDDVVVMLDAQTAFTEHVDEHADIYWGAYLGTPDEVLISGPVREVAGEIERARAEARDRKGWIMDTYLVRRQP